MMHLNPFDIVELRTGVRCAVVDNMLTKVRIHVKDYDKELIYAGNRPCAKKICDIIKIWYSFNHNGIKLNGIYKSTENIAPDWERNG